MPKSSVILSFKPKAVTKELLGTLSERAQDIMKKRYGLGAETERQTLEAIGKEYGITRERVRQIENFSLSTIRRSDEFVKAEPFFEELRDSMDDYGKVVKESSYLDHLSEDQGFQNHVHFLLVLGDYFEKLREDDDFFHRWTVDEDLAEKVHKGLKNLYKELSDDDLVSGTDIVSKFMTHLRKEMKDLRDEEIAKRWLTLAKFIGQNPLGEWGVSHSPNVKARGVRDLAYLVIRDHGSPMHFTEVASSITERFGKKAHQATVHNELIKDKRFVLVGRGLYALREWGYERGVVRDVIKDILNEEGPLKKEDIVDKVLKERHVKENTILVNLQNSKYFKKDKSGRYKPV
ncbi:hypothetical protein CL654_02225 [bacterium]|nr:hypothetical protein [bacterium]|tara:strand:+ start:2008 stop:3048 length:1041 start_codon:yes stop_codon:yes gene_type:complete